MQFRKKLLFYIFYRLLYKHSVNNSNIIKYARRGKIMSTLELNNISKTFSMDIGDYLVLDNINLRVENSEIVGIVGPSGSGKTTILNIISGIIKPTNGELKVNGKMGYMFQKDLLFEWRTIWKNLLIGLEITKQNDKIHQEKIKKRLEKYGLDEFINNYPSELSGGMRQRIALIRTLSTDPNILLLDEPFSALDYQTRLLIADDIYEVIKSEKLTSILVTHDISEAISMCDRIVVLTQRPATIKKIIKLEFDKSLSPLERRKEHVFQRYFDEVWGLINEN